MRVAIACFFFISAAGTAAAAQTAPLRSLVYEVRLDVRVVDRQEASGINRGGMPRRGLAPVGVQSAGTRERAADASDVGRLKVDVVAATGDGGLVVDAQLAGSRVAQPPLRVAIASDGRLGFDPSRELSVEAARLLPLLARGLLANRDVDLGLDWESGDGRGRARFHVADKDGERVTLRVATDLVPSAGTTEHDDAVILYDAAKVCPVRYTLNARIDRHRAAGDDETVSQTFTAALLSDSFAKR